MTSLSPVVVTLVGWAVLDQDLNALHYAGLGVGQVLGHCGGERGQRRCSHRFQPVVDAAPAAGHVSPARILP
jgi:hypothetical protein